jgi:hypothetical protein
MILGMILLVWMAFGGVYVYSVSEYSEVVFSEGDAETDFGISILPHYTEFEAPFLVSSLNGGSPFQVNCTGLFREKSEYVKVRIESAVITYNNGDVEPLVQDATDWINVHEASFPVYQHGKLTQLVRRGFDCTLASSLSPKTEGVQTLDIRVTLTLANSSGTEFGKTLHRRYCLTEKYWITGYWIAQARKG